MMQNCVKFEESLLEVLIDGARPIHVFVYRQLPFVYP